MILNGPSPHGEGGLKWRWVGALHSPFGPSPHGEGGLKFGLSLAALPLLMSLPSRGGWIEIDVFPS